MSIILANTPFSYSLLPYSPTPLPSSPTSPLLSCSHVHTRVRQLFVSKTAGILQQALDRNEHNDVKYMLRMLAELTNARVVDETAFVALLQSFVASAREVRVSYTVCVGCFRCFVLAV